MEIFYLKINWPNVNSKYYLEGWINIVRQFKDAKAYIVCDNSNLREYVQKAINFSRLDYEFIESSRNDEDLKYIVENSRIANHWKFAAYAHLTTFLHARNMGYKNFWNIDADDIEIVLEPQKAAELLTKIKQYAETHEINLFSLDIWATFEMGQHWSFGVTYADNSVNWIEIMRAHCTDAKLTERYTMVRSSLNLDWFCTYLRSIQAARIETFCVENLRFVQRGDNPYLNPVWGIIYWNNGKCFFSAICGGIGDEELGTLDIPAEVIQLDFGLPLNERINLWGARKNFNFQRFEYAHGRNIPVSLIYPVKKNESNAPPLQIFS